MTANTTSSCILSLSGLNGANPLGFLAALGAQAVLRQSGYEKVRLGWVYEIRWTPVLECDRALDVQALCESLAASLAGDTVSEDAEEKRAETQRIFDAAKKAVGGKVKELKKRGLKGKERSQAREAELVPLEKDAEEKRNLWLGALKHAVRSPELALGKQINCTEEEFREHAAAFLEHARHDERRTPDLLAAFGSDACLREKSNIIESTPFCFITGSGHQYFLETARQLMECVTSERVRAALFEPWTYQDEKLSMRWDPIEDRRYALMDRDPTASDNKSRTVWMANLLAYRGLAAFPCAPGKKKLVTTAWQRINEEDIFTWPLWELPLDFDSVCSLLQNPELYQAQRRPLKLRERGIVAAFRTRRIQVGSSSQYKVNFSPATSVFAITKAKIPRAFPDDFGANS